MLKESIMSTSWKAWPCAAQSKWLFITYQEVYDFSSLLRNYVMNNASFQVFRKGRAYCSSTNTTIQYLEGKSMWYLSAIVFCWSPQIPNQFTSIWVAISYINISKEVSTTTTLSKHQRFLCFWVPSTVLFFSSILKLRDHGYSPYDQEVFRN